MLKLVILSHYSITILVKFAQIFDTDYSNSERSTAKRSMLQNFSYMYTLILTSKHQNCDVLTYYYGTVYIY